MSGSGAIEMVGWALKVNAEYHEMKRIIQRVRDLHQPFTTQSGKWCKGCEDWEDRSTEWPCPTVRVLYSEPGISKSLDLDGEQA